MRSPRALSLARAGLLGNPAPLGFAGEVILEEWKLDPFWFALGMLGQAVFFSRFLVQWIASERAGRSYIPRVFWWLSLAGSMLLLAYAIHRKDPVFVLGQAFGWLVYARNLVLLRRGEAAAA